MTDRMRVGVVGCGLIAQVMHLPYLADSTDRFEIAAVCDLSRAGRGRLRRALRLSPRSELGGAAGASRSTRC